ncbi:MAG: hypothetical protein ACO3KD_09430 [Gaiellales bacterium]
MALVGHGALILALLLAVWAVGAGLMAAAPARLSWSAWKSAVPSRIAALAVRMP